MNRALLAIVAGLVLAAPATAKTVAGLAPDVGAHSHVSHARRATVQALSYHGGPVLHSNRTHLIFWQPSGSGLTFEPGYTELIRSFLVNVAADSHHTTNPYALTGQYTDAHGPAVYDSSFGGSVLDGDPLPGSGCLEPPITGPGWTVCLTDNQLAVEIEHVVRSRNLPTTPRDIYFLVTPKGLGSCTDASSTSCALGGQLNGYCGYHSQTADGAVLYAVIPYNAVAGHCQSDNPRPNSNSADPTLSTVSHEQNELITDPTDDAWVDSSGNEDGDLCITTFGPTIGGSGATAYNESIHGGHYFLQEEWSNADGGCAARTSSDSARFAVRRAGRLVSLAGIAAAPNRQIVAYQWFFGDRHSAAGRRVTHRFPRRGTYTVLLRAIDSWGNWAVYARAIRIAGR
jgi:hypothetical protein